MVGTLLNRLQDCSVILQKEGDIRDRKQNIKKDDPQRKGYEIR